jgi:hypothetical protein
MSVREREPLAEPPTQRSMARLVIGPRTPSTTSVPAEAPVRASAGREDERDAAAVDPALTAAPLARVSPATVLQCGQAPGPWA